MSERAFPMWVFGAVAALIAILALAVAQIAPGAGMVVVAGASSLWSVWAVARGRKAAGA